jgi:hypothetical protein
VYRSICRPVDQNHVVFNTPLRRLEVVAHRLVAGLGGAVDAPLSELMSEYHGILTPTSSALES